MIIHDRKIEDSQVARPKTMFVGLLTAVCLQTPMLTYARLGAYRFQWSRAPALSAQHRVHIPGTLQQLPKLGMILYGRILVGLPS
jgi:hypothetical protein